MYSGKKAQHDFPKMRGGDQRPFGTFPKIHPFWKRRPSLSVEKNKSAIAFQVRGVYRIFFGFSSDFVPTFVEFFFFRLP